MVCFLLPFTFIIQYIVEQAVFHDLQVFARCSLVGSGLTHLMIHLTGPFEARTSQGASFVTDPGHPLRTDTSKLGGTINIRPAGQESCGSWFLERGTNPAELRQWLYYDVLLS